jgi:hypothetical protein
MASVCEAVMMGANVEEHFAEMFVLRAWLHIYLFAE